MITETVFRFPERIVGKIAAKKMISAYPMIICVLIAAFIIANHLENNEFIEDTSLMLIFAGMAVVFLVGGFFSGKKAIEKVLKDTKFVLKENSIEKHIPNGENTLIGFREIRSFHETKSGVLIKTTNKRLRIPSGLEGFKNLSKGIRSHIHTHVISHSTKFKVHRSIINNAVAFGTLLLIVGFFIAETQTHKLLLGIPLFLFVCVALVKIIADKKSKQLESSILVKAVIFTIILLVYLIYVILNFDYS